MIGTPADHRPTRVLLGITGSIAAAHSPGVVIALRQICGLEVQCVLTAAAGRFVTTTSLAVTSGRPVLTDDHDTAAPVVDHMAATRWADLVLVMPATADFLGRTAQGLAPDLLGTCLLAADCPVVVVPSMNPAMWAKPVVQRNCATLRSDGIGVVPPGLGFSAHDGTLGEGSMPILPRVLAWIESWATERGTPLSLSGGPVPGTGGVPVGDRIGGLSRAG
jgi:phosphopantothenoylcysteine decarboxylase/phosphopantothenate--cysteine ligase